MELFGFLDKFLKFLGLLLFDWFLDLLLFRLFLRLSFYWDIDGYSLIFRLERDNRWLQVVSIEDVLLTGFFHHQIDHHTLVLFDGPKVLTHQPESRLSCRVYPIWVETSPTKIYEL